MQPNHEPDTGMGKAFKKAGYVSRKDQAIKAFVDAQTSLLTEQIDLFVHISPLQILGLFRDVLAKVVKAYKSTKTVSVSDHKRSPPGSHTPTASKPAIAPLTFAAAKKADFDRVPPCFYLPDGKRIDKLKYSELESLRQLYSDESEHFHRKGDLYRYEGVVRITRILEAGKPPSQNMRVGEFHTNKNKLTKILEGK